MTTRLAIASTALFLCVACHHRAVTPPLAPSADYSDLAPGASLRITLPLSEQAFEIIHYRVQGNANGRVSLRFESARTTSNGKTIEETSPPPLPFALPQNNRHIRLIFLIRVSAADHNMAIAASKDLAKLNTFTGRLRNNSASCPQTGAVSCVWVPEHAAVRPE